MSKKLAVAFCLTIAVACASAASGQVDRSRRSVLNQSVEEKRNELFRIRNQRSEAASRSAIPGLQDAVPVVRATAAGAVVFLPPAEAASVLIPLLRDPDEFVRREAAYALGAVGDPSAVSPLSEMMRREKPIEVRSAAAIALGEIASTTAVESLLAVLRTRPRESDEFLRRSAARSIGQIAQFQRTGVRRVVTPQNFLPDRYKSLSHGPPASDPDLVNAVATLMKVLTASRESDDTRREAAFSLGAIGGRASLPKLESAARSTDVYLAETAKEAIAKIASEPK